VNIADLFEFESAFEGDRIIKSAAEKEPVFAVFVFLSNLTDEVGLAENPADFLRDGGQFVQEGLNGIGAEVSASSQFDGQHSQDGHLSGEGLGAGDADFRADSQIYAGISEACNRGADGVDNAQDQGTAFFGLFDSRQRIGGFAGLADGNDDSSFFENGIAVSEFAGVFDLGWDAGELFE